MKMNIDILKTFELKLAEYAKANGTIAEHDSSNMNCKDSCSGSCTGNCFGSCAVGCTGSGVSNPPESPRS